MAERSIKLRLQAEVADFNRQIQSSARTLGDFEKSAEKMGGASDTTLGKLKQSATINRQEWSTVGGVLTTVGGAITAVGAAALTTGIKYNTLQQTSRAALTTIFKDGERANQQMDKLDAFASTSPFAKDVFIRAQQQMLGFGIEAQKVIPYLDSIQNAVAATGGSNQDIEELTRIFSQVAASAKITATDLMQFGKRGIDAAGLIGEAMGKTGAEIREEITAGTLDAGVALDALAAGMAETYDGAAAGVKETFAGAMDRVKAAWRDLSAELASPLVGQEGGGLAIDGLNALADAMRQFQSAPTWVKGGVAAIGGLTGAVALTGGTMMLAVPKWLAYKEAVATLSNTHPLLGKFNTALGKLGKAIGIAAGVAVAAGAFIKLADALGDKGVAANADRALAALNGIGDANIDSLFLEATAGAYDLNDAMERLANPKFGYEWGMNMAESLGIGSNSALNAKKTFEELDATIAGFVRSGDLESAATLFDVLDGQLDKTKFTTEELVEMFPQYNDALAAHAAESQMAAGSADTYSTSLESLSERLENLTDDQLASKEAIEAWADTLRSAGESFGGVLSAYDKAIAKNLELDESFKASSLGIDDWIDELARQRKATEDWAANYSTALQQIASETDATGKEAHTAFVNEMVAAGEDGAAALQTFVDATPAQRAELVAEWAGAGAAVEDAMGAVELLLETDDAVYKFNTVTGEWSLYKATTNLDLDTLPGWKSFRESTNDWENTKTDTILGADTSPADKTFGELTADWDRTLTSTNLDADTRNADGSFKAATDNWRNTTTPTLLNLENNLAQAAFKSTTTGWANKTTDTNLGLDTRPAVTGLSSFLNQIPTSRTIQLRTSGSIGGGGSLYRDALYSGGFVKGLAAGGTVPGPRAGRDNIGWPLISQGQLLTQPLEGGEFVVRSSQAVKYEPQLRAMNAGIYRPGLYQGGSVSGVTPAEGPQGVSVSDLDYIADRIARQMVSASRGAGSAAYVSASDYTNQLFRDAAVVRR